MTAGGAVDSYSSFLEAWLNEQFPGAQLRGQAHRVINWGRPSATSAFFSFCANYMLPPQVPLRKHGSGSASTPAAAAAAAQLLDFT